MADREKVFDAIRNCVTEPKCKDCPWEDCEKIGCKRVTVPVTLLLDTLNLLKEQSQVVRCKDCKNWTPGWVDDYDTFIPPRCKRNSGVWASNDYCSYVDRKVEQDETD